VRAKYRVYVFTSPLRELRCEHMCTAVLLCTVHVYEQNNVFLNCSEDGDCILPGQLPLYQPTRRNIPVIWNRNDTLVLALWILHRIISAQFSSESFVLTDISTGLLISP
jgi:hypothetical protein